MKDIALNLALEPKDSKDQLNVLREYLQAYILRVLYECHFFQNHAFLGGTALRFIDRLPRYSEDLDFSTIRTSENNFVKVLETLKKELTLANYEVSMRYNEKNIVQYAWIKFAKILYEANLSPMPDQNLSIKIEIDTNPPSGAKCNTHVDNTFFPLSFVCYDHASLFAGKIHALLSRKYSKGRDYFDLAWYLTRYPKLLPNFELLNNATQQSKAISQQIDEQNWKGFLIEVIQNANWDKILKDVDPFVQKTTDAQILLDQNTIIQCLK